MDFMNLNSRKYLSKILHLLVPVLIFGAGLYIGSRGQISDIEKVSYIGNKEPTIPTTADFAPFWKVWNVLNDKFVDTHATSTSSTSPAYKPVTDEQKVYGAISGLVKSLGDPYTVFMPPTEAGAFQDDISGSFQGVGMEVGMKSEILTVIAPLEGTPAKKAGIRPGDKIVKIDGNVTAGLSVEDAVKMIRGPKGTTVALSMFRDGEPDLLEFKVVRDVITIPVMDIGDKKSVNKDGSLQNAKGGTVTDESNTGLRKDGIFVMRLYNFSQPAPDFFRQALKKFMDSKSDKLILDLRGNPGGYLEAAVDIASWFLPANKVVVREVINKQGDETIHRSKGYDIFNGNLKMAVLIDGGSASASEILAGALSDNGVAKLIGVQSFGKGSVQELVPVTSDTFVKVTIAKWLTPNGNWISFRGLTPDIVVTITKEDILAGKDPQFDRAVKYLLTGK